MEKSKEIAVVEVSEDTIRKLAEGLRAMYGEINHLNDVLHAELFEHFTSFGDISEVLQELVNAFPGESGSDLIFEYLNDRKSYDEMIAEIQTDWVNYERYYGK